jgi:hypothetical protein
MLPWAHARNPPRSVAVCALDTEQETFLPWLQNAPLLIEEVA